MSERTRRRVLCFYALVSSIAILRRRNQQIFTSTRISVNYTSQVLCPACNSSKRAPLLYEKNGSPIFRCTDCGLGHAAPAGFVPATYYTEDYFNGGHADGYSDYTGSAEVLRIEFGRIAQGLDRYINAGSKVLEIGCAYGFFLKEAEARYEVHGIELAKSAVDYCHRQGLTNVRCGVADKNTLEQIGSVDAIVMLDVIEHLTDPFEVLKNCVGILKPGGVILISTGDFASITARISGKHWRLMTPPQHLWFFSRKSIEESSGRLGLETVIFKRPWKLVPLSLISYQLARIFGFSWSPSRFMPWSRIGIPINLFDAMHAVLRKPHELA